MDDVIKINSLKDLKTAFDSKYEGEAKLEEKREKLREFNINCENLDEIDILENDLEYIVVKNNVSGEFIYCEIKYFRNRFFERKGESCCTLYQATYKDGVISEKYYYLPYACKVNSYKKYVKNGMLNENSLIFKRVYCDVETKYGPFCFVLQEDGNEDFRYNPSTTSVALYHGSSNEIIQRSSLLEPTHFLIFKNTKAENNFYNFMLGHICGDVREHRWCYESEDSKQKLYSFVNKKSEGVICSDGSLDILKDNKYEPQYSYYVKSNFEKLSEYLSQETLEAKAYICLPNLSYLIIEKDSKQINIKVISELTLNRKHKKVFETSIPSLNLGDFSKEEILKINELLSNQKCSGYFGYTPKNFRKHFDINSIDLFSSVIKELNNYCNYLEKVNKSDFNFMDPYSLPISNFEKAIEELQAKNKTELVEQLIEKYSLEYNISKEELLGDSTKAKEWMKMNKEFRVDLQFEGYVDSEYIFKSHVKSLKQ